MSSTLYHRGYEGSVQYSAEDKMLHGRLLTASDLISYGGLDLAELEINFRDAVDEYLAFCAETGKTPDQPGPSPADIHIRRELQTHAVRFAEQHDRQLDTVVNDALEEYLAKSA